MSSRTPATPTTGKAAVCSWPVHAPSAGVRRRPLPALLRTAPPTISYPRQSLGSQAIPQNPQQAARLGQSTDSASGGEPALSTSPDKASLRPAGRRSKPLLRGSSRRGTGTEQPLSSTTSSSLPATGRSRRSCCGSAWPAGAPAAAGPAAPSRSTSAAAAAARAAAAGRLRLQCRGWSLHLQTRQMLLLLRRLRLLHWGAPRSPRARPLLSPAWRWRPAAAAAAWRWGRARWAVAAAGSTTPTSWRSVCFCLRDRWVQCALHCPEQHRSLAAARRRVAVALLALTRQTACEPAALGCRVPRPRPRPECAWLASFMTSMARAACHNCCAVPRCAALHCAVQVAMSWGQLVDLSIDAGLGENFVTRRVFEHAVLARRCSCSSCSAACPRAHSSRP